MRFAIPSLLTLVALLLSVGAVAGDRETGLDASYEAEPIVPPMESTLARATSATKITPPAAPTPGEDRDVEGEVADDGEG